MRRIESFIIILGLAFTSVDLVGCGPSTSSSGPPGSTTTVGGGGVGAGANTSVSDGGSGYQVGSGGTAGTAGTTSHDGTAPPGCGDGKINQPSEQCDDNNTRAGDGCSGVCKVEPNYICPIDPNDSTHSLPCVVNFKCGDGVINTGGGEVCDQGQYQGSPGCSADCKTQDPGYKCLPAEQCVALFQCGNGRIERGETCDPPNPGKGCNATCQTETGWRCRPGSCAKLPYCGDGIVQTDQGEKCDQGTFQNAQHPGCSLDCQSMDATCTCSPGKACVCQTPTCGDGIVQVGEQCDDKNSAYPGCSATCQLEPGYQCPFAGAPCVPKCGDGILVTPAEQCDPAANIPNVAQACNADCSVKPGWACTASNCQKTVCGNGTVEGSEGCDPSPKNNDLGDGCTANCMAEPTCPAAGGGCTTKCGDGLILGTEKCDDGNAVSGDGCSSTCQIEDGFTCTQPPLGDTMVVPMVVRDFNAGGDFEPAAGFATGLNYANQGLVQGQLDTNGLKPVFAGSTTGTYNGTPGQPSAIASTASFAQWFNDAAPAAGNTYHATLGTTLNLFLITGSNPPTYVNRYGTNGDGLTSTQYLRTHTNQCGTTNQSNHDAAGNALPCTACYYNATDPLNLTPCTQNDTTPCQTDATYTGQCKVNGNAWIGTFLDAAFDGNPLFFPADAIATPWSPNSLAQISGNYDTSWPADPTGKTHNFSFTTEVRFWFSYDSTKTYKLTFVGDDDVWVFINKKLAVDLGGIHTAVQGVITFGATATTTTVTPTNVTPVPAGIVSHPNLGLTNGGVFEIAVFQVERQTKASSYQLSLGGFNAAHSVCKPVCGGPNPGVSPGEQCDNGTAGNCDPAASDCYNKCTISCTLGPRCGDSVVNGPEQCDNGKNTDGYAAAGSNACSPNCTLPPSCGDGLVQLDYNEECDLSNDATKGPGNYNDGSYGGCTAGCKYGPSCGDNKVNGDAAHPEACDDGVNDGTYNTCGKGCTLPPRCGDGVLQTDWGEQCEPVASDDPNCTASCQLPGGCGDAVLQSGEQCDYGTDPARGQVNDGAYGGCNANCTLAPNCGDGITNGPEQCDLGATMNIGDYGGCTSTCLFGPHCGDGQVNGPEQCDDGSDPATGNGSATSHCTTQCMKYIAGPPT